LDDWVTVSTRASVVGTRDTATQFVDAIRPIVQSSIRQILRNSQDEFSAWPVACGGVHRVRAGVRALDVQRLDQRRISATT
jgi:hypothetical protein